MLADMENLRQRTRREVEAASQFAIQRFCKDIVGVADVLEMALASVRLPKRSGTAASGAAGGADADAAALPDVGDAPGDSAKQLRDLVEGLGMTLDEMHRTLGKHGVSVVDPLHQKFDPNLHNALFEVPAADVEPGTIVAVQKKGYVLNQRVIRPADVGVARKSA